MISSAQIQGLKGRHVIARGNAPGNRGENSQALKGRNRIQLCCNEVGFGDALAGLDSFGGIKPGASPRAVTLRPCRADERMVNA